MYSTRQCYHSTTVVLWNVVVAAMNCIQKCGGTITYLTRFAKTSLVCNKWQGTHFTTTQLIHQWTNNPCRVCIIAKQLYNVLIATKHNHIFDYGFFDSKCSLMNKSQPLLYWSSWLKYAVKYYHTCTNFRGTSVIGRFYIGERYCVLHALGD